MKKFFATALASVGGAFAALAEGGTSGISDPIVTVNDVAQIFDTAQTDMASLIDAALPVVIAFVCGGLIIWGALALIGVIKRGLNAGKGR